MPGHPELDLVRTADEPERRDEMARTDLVFDEDQRGHRQAEAARCGLYDEIEMSVGLVMGESQIRAACRETS